MTTAVLTTDMAGTYYCNTDYRYGREFLLQYLLKKWEGMTTAVLTTDMAGNDYCSTVYRNGRE
jgi:hypothetical protein